MRLELDIWLLDANDRLVQQAKSFLDVGFFDLKYKTVGYIIDKNSSLFE